MTVEDHRTAVFRAWPPSQPKAAYGDSLAWSKGCSRPHALKAYTSRFALPSYDSAVNGTKPPLPTRASSSSPLPPPTLAPQAPPSLKLTTKDRVLLSLDLILSTIDDSACRVLDTGTQEIGKVVGHKYGPEAVHLSLLMAGTARNVGLVYVDLKGVGRRALVRRAGRTFVKAQMSSVGAGQSQIPPALPPR